MDERFARLLGATLTTALVVFISAMKGAPLSYFDTFLAFSITLLVFKQEIDDL